ncbi:ribonuclease H-like domain-containing protein, partial [Suillus occidentalis]
DSIQVYSDGSGYQGNIGAAAVLFRAGRQPRVLRFHLGSEDEHTVFEGEAVGLMLAAELIATEDDPTFPISILIDNQAAIQSGETFHSCPSSYLTDLYCNRLRDIAKDHRNFNVTIRWVPGHKDVHGNEEADKQAKKASEGPRNNSPSDDLPTLLR